MGSDDQTECVREMEGGGRPRWIMDGKPASGWGLRVRATVRPADTK